MEVSQRARNELPDAGRDFAEIEARLTGRRPALFLDYDGVLAPIVRHPDEALLTEANRRLIAELAGRFPVAIVSGRDVADIQAKVGLSGIYYAGSHGYEIVDTRGEAMSDDSFAGFGVFLESLDSVSDRLERELSSTPGAEVDRKRFAVAVHFRQVDETLLPDLERAVTEAAVDFPMLRMGRGKKIFELRPDHDWDKGKAVQWICQRLSDGDRAVLPLYLGDDTTDEDVFRILEAGIGIVVGYDGPPSMASYALQDPAAVSRFLRRINESDALKQS